MWCPLAAHPICHLHNDRANFLGCRSSVQFETQHVEKIKMWSNSWDSCPGGIMWVTAREKKVQIINIPQHFPNALLQTTQWHQIFLKNKLRSEVRYPSRHCVEYFVFLALFVAAKSISFETSRTLRRFFGMSSGLWNAEISQQKLFSQEGFPEGSMIMPCWMVFCKAAGHILEPATKLCKLNSNLRPYPLKSCFKKINQRADCIFEFTLRARAESWMRRTRWPTHLHSPHPKLHRKNPDLVLGIFYAI